MSRSGVRDERQAQQLISVTIPFLPVLPFHTFMLTKGLSSIPPRRREMSLTGFLLPKNLQFRLRLILPCKRICFFLEQFHPFFAQAEKRRRRNEVKSEEDEMNYFHGKYKSSANAKREITNTRRFYLWWGSLPVRLPALLPPTKRNSFREQRKPPLTHLHPNIIKKSLFSAYDNTIRAY